MASFTTRLSQKLDKILIPIIAQRLEEWQRKLRHYHHQEIKKKLKFVGSKVRFKRDIEISYPENISLGHRVYIGPDVLLDGRGGITIGDYTTIGFNTVILSANHDYQSNDLPYEHNVYICKPVTIGKNVWIAGNVLIVPGITIGDGAIIAAGTVVSKDVEPLAIVASQPMRVLKYRDRDHYEQLAKQQTSPISQSQAQEVITIVKEPEE